jgi:hypothetical protein
MFDVAAHWWKDGRKFRQPLTPSASNMAADLRSFVAGTGFEPVTSGL